MDSSPKLAYLPTGGVISTSFVFQTVPLQNAAAAVYVQKSTTDGLYGQSNSSKKYVFKTDYERMQYIIGRQGKAPGASGY